MRKETCGKKKRLKGEWGWWCGGGCGRGKGVGGTLSNGVMRPFSRNVNDFSCFELRLCGHGFWLVGEFGGVWGIEEVCVCVTWLLHMYDETNSRKNLAGVCAGPACDCGVWKIEEVCVCVWHDSFIRVTWLIQVRIWRGWGWDWGGLRVCITWPIHVCDVTHSCVRRDSFMCATWLIHVRIWRGIVQAGPWIGRDIRPG